MRLGMKLCAVRALRVRACISHQPAGCSWRSMCMRPERPAEGNLSRSLAFTCKLYRPVINVFSSLAWQNQWQHGSSGWRRSVCVCVCVCVAFVCASFSCSMRMHMLFSEGRGSRLCSGVHDSESSHMSCLCLPYVQPRCHANEVIPPPEMKSCSAR